jgi:hypothetical protein
MAPITDDSVGFSGIFLKLEKVRLGEVRLG